jgi:hypothetical protein
MKNAVPKTAIGALVRAVPTNLSERLGLTGVPVADGTRQGVLPQVRGFGLGLVHPNSGHFAVLHFLVKT